jgi:hypothetical protein
MIETEGDKGPRSRNEVGCFGDLISRSTGKTTALGAIMKKVRDIRIETKDFGSGIGVVPTMIYVVGCRTCQQTKSKCKCETPDFIERWIYNRERGVINLTMLERLNAKAGAQPPVETV